MSRAPWVAHFGLTRAPFSKSIAAKDLFGRDAHAEAVARINFCIAESALGVLVGDVGAGETVAVRAAVAGLDPTSHHVVYVPNTAFGTRGLYVTIVSALGGHARFRKAEVMAQAASLLAAEEAERHRRVVLVIDDAHLLTPAQLEELRGVDQRGDGLGQPLRRHPGRPAHAGPLPAHGRHRRPRPAHRHPLQPAGDGPGRVGQLPPPPPGVLAGRSDPLIADDAIARLHRAANGLARALNNATVAALIAAASADKALVDDTCARKAVTELTRD